MHIDEISSVVENWWVTNVKDNIEDTSHTKFNIIQLLPLCAGNMTICSPEAGNIAWGPSPRVILHVEGEQIVMLSSHKGNNCFIIPTCFIISFSL